MNKPFRRTVDMYCNPDTTHWCIDDARQELLLPLPKQTTLAFRTGPAHAKYATKKSKAEIVDFYKSITEKDTFEKAAEENAITFIYESQPFKITIEDGENCRYIYIVGINY